MVKVLFLAFIFLAPLGLLAAFGLTLARTARAKGDVAKALTLRARAAEKFWYTIVSTLLGLLGYWTVTRNLIPWLEPELVIILFLFALATMHFIVRRTLNVPKWKGWF